MTDPRNNLRSVSLAQRIKHKYLIIYFSFSIAVNKNLCFSSQYLIHLNLFKCVMPLIDKEKIPTAL